jgi:hypothetical protein
MQNSIHITWANFTETSTLCLMFKSSEKPSSCGAVAYSYTCFTISYYKVNPVTDSPSDSVSFVPFSNAFDLHKNVTHTALFMRAGTQYDT